MKLSEAIRLGCTLRKQSKGDFFDEDGGGTCALGAALDAIGFRQETDGLHLFMHNAFPLLQFASVCPESLMIRKVGSIIVNLNDKFGWTREDIANWVETVEKGLDKTNENTKEKSLEPTHADYATAS